MASAPLTHISQRPALGAPPFLAALICIVAMLVLTPASAPAASPGKTLGVYAGPGSPEGVAKFENGAGRPVAIVHDALARENWANLIDIEYWTRKWTPTRHAGRIYYSVPMLPDTGGSLAAGAAGDYNNYFRTLAQRFVASGQGGATLRLGPEFNGNWFKWTINVPNGGANYAAYWRQIVTTMRSVQGANFKFDWCPNAGSSYVNGKQMKAETAWPGGAYVDYIGADIYDQSWLPNFRDPEARWKDFMNTGNGLKWHAAFAKAQGKPMTFPEWGIANRYDGQSGGDAPQFIEHMYSWIRANNVAFHMYFEWADPNADYRIFNGKTPKAAKRFRELFSPDDAGDIGSGAGGANGGATTGTDSAKLNIKTVKISPRSRRLRLVATLAPGASGVARITLSAGGRKTSFSKKISRGRLKVSKRISRKLARKGTGTVTVRYGGNATTRAQQVRLKIARGGAKLRLVSGPSISASRISASGTISKRARGVVRIQLSFVLAGKNITRVFRARIGKGRWSLNAAIPANVQGGLAQRSGTAEAYAIYTGSSKVSGAMKLYDVLAAR